MKKEKKELFYAIEKIFKIAHRKMSIHGNNLYAIEEIEYFESIIDRLFDLKNTDIIKYNHFVVDIDDITPNNGINFILDGIKDLNDLAIKNGNSHFTTKYTDIISKVSKEAF